MKIDYRRDLQHNYLVAETEEDAATYITRMMTENQIEGLLACTCRCMDQKNLYYYDITSRISLAEKCRYKKIKGSEVLLVIQGLLKILVQLEEYLIPADQICLDWNYIYLEPATGRPFFCCLPVAEEGLEQGIRELLEELLPRLDHQEKEGAGVSVVYELYQYTIQDSFSVMELQNILERRMVGSCVQTDRTEGRALQAVQTKREQSGENAYGKTPGYIEKSSGTEKVQILTPQEEEEKRILQKNHERALEDFFSTEEEVQEEGEKKKMPVLLILAVLGGCFYVAAWYAAWEYVPEYLGVWGAFGVIAALGFLIGIVVVKKKRKEESQIEEQFAVYQGTAESRLRCAEPLREDWEEKEEEIEPIQNWSGQISGEENNYTQVLSSVGPGQNRLILKELHPVSGRQFYIEASHPVVIGQLKEQADLVLPSAAVSRIHASIEKRAGVWYIKDLNSRNGTWVNDRELYGEEEKPLFPDDQIRFADLVYQVVL